MLKVLISLYFWLLKSNESLTCAALCDSHVCSCSTCFYAILINSSTRSKSGTMHSVLYGESAALELPLHRSVSHDLQPKKLRSGNKGSGVSHSESSTKPQERRTKLISSAAVRSQRQLNFKLRTISQLTHNFRHSTLSDTSSSVAVDIGRRYLLAIPRHRSLFWVCHLVENHRHISNH